MPLTGQAWEAILPPSWKDRIEQWLHDDMPKVRAAAAPRWLKKNAPRCRG